MTIEILIGFSLLMIWTVISITKYLKESRRKQELFYSNLLNLLEDFRVEKGNAPYPKIAGTFRGIKIFITPYINSLAFRTLPKLHIKLYLAVPNSYKLKVKPCDLLQCVSNGGKIFSENERIVAIIKELNLCDQVVFDKNLVYVSFPVATAEKTYYQVMRSAIFPEFALQEEMVNNIISGILALREELTDYVQQNKNTCLVNHSSSHDNTCSGACFTG